MGFDSIQIPIEIVGDLDYKTAAQIIRDNGLEVSACAAMGPDRDLLLPETQQNGIEYIQHCIEGTRLLGGSQLVGPIYTAVGRTWQATPDQRARDVDVLVEQ